jgi:hypothetical protein
MQAVVPKRVAVLLLATTVSKKTSSAPQKPRWIDATVKGLSPDGHVLTVTYDADASKDVTVDVREKVVAVIDVEVPDGPPSAAPTQAPRAQRRIRHMISWTCDLHMLSLILVNACFAAFGAKGGMDHIHVLQLGYKFGYVCHQNWPKYKALLRHYFPDEKTVWQ